MRPIAAFSLSDYENLTRNPYQIAEFKRGKDKQKRKRRGLGIAGAVAGGLAGAGALAAGVRYGGAEIGLRRARGRATGLANDITDAKAAQQAAGRGYAYKKGVGQTGSKLRGDAFTDNVASTNEAYDRAYAAGKANAKVMTSGGASGALKRDYNRLRNSFGGRTGNAIDAVKNTFKNTGRAIQGGYRTGSLGVVGMGERGQFAPNRVAKGVVGAGRAALGTTGGKIAAGLGAAGLVAGAGYGAYRMLNKNKKKK